MQPFNLIVHNTSQLLYRMGWDARNELYCSALHMSRPYQVRRVGNTKVFFPLLCNKPATIANKNTLFFDTNLLDWTLLIKYILAWFLALREMYRMVPGFERDVSSLVCDCETSPQVEAQQQRFSCRSDLPNVAVQRACVCAENAFQHR